MFIPNIVGLLSRKTGDDLYGQGVFGPAKPVQCAVVHAQHVAQKTPVRADSSASRGNAEEEIAVAKFLFAKTVSIAIDDKFVALGMTMRVMKAEARLDVNGLLDHYEVELGLFQR